MIKLNKLKNNTGSALILSIMLMLIVSVVIIMFSSQILNVFKTTSKNYNYLKVKYELEAGLEEAIAEVVTKLENQYTDLVRGKDIVENSSYTYLKTEDKILNISIPEINDSLGYTISPIYFTLNLKMDEYKESKKNNYQYVIKNLNTHTQKIIVTREYNEKIYTNEYNVKFMISDAVSGKVSYAIDSWE